MQRLKFFYSKDSKKNRTNIDIIPINLLIAEIIKNYEEINIFHIIF